MRNSKRNEVTRKVREEVEIKRWKIYTKKDMKLRVIRTSIV